MQEIEKSNSGGKITEQNFEQQPVHEIQSNITENGYYPFKIEASDQNRDEKQRISNVESSINENSVQYRSYETEFFQANMNQQSNIISPMISPDRIDFPGKSYQETEANFIHSSHMLLNHPAYKELVMLESKSNEVEE